jgi:hypothetical protein
LAPIVAILNAVIALPSTLVSVRSRKWGSIVWVCTLALVVLGIVAWYFTYWADESHASVFLWSWILQFVLYFLAPQVLAYPLTRHRPALRPVAAGGLALVAVLAWAMLGLVTGATSD